MHTTGVLMDKSTHNHKLLPLPNPIRQIRLLFVRSGGVNDIVACDVSIWNLDNAPSFTAISYTWGPPEFRAEIIVDGQSQTVRKNCAYALWQTRLHFPDSYVWIDSVCIKQQDLKEKSAQVNMMGDIYAKSAKVVACIGPSDESSDYIRVALPKMDSLIHDASDEYWTEKRHEDSFWYPLGTSSRSTIVELVRHWNMFSERPYFSRVWVVQELFGGRGRTIVLCGNDILSWDLLKHLQYRLVLCCDFAPFTFQCGNCAHDVYKVDTLLQAYNSERFQFPDILEKAGDCENLRDRIYGMLRLIDWERFGVPRPLPDYTITIPQLALQAVERVRDLDLNNTELIASRLEVSLQELTNMSSYSNANDAITRHRTWTSGLCGARPIYEDNEQRLCVSMTSNLASEYPNLALSTIDSVDAVSRRYRRRLFGGKSPLHLYTGNSVSVLACPETLSGDILVEMSLTNYWVLRPTNNTSVYGMVGKAIVLDSVHFFKLNDSNESIGHEQSCEHQNPRLAFDISDLEALSLGAASNQRHDACYGRKGAYEFDETARYQRVRDCAYEFATINVPNCGSKVFDITECKCKAH